MTKERPPADAARAPAGSAAKAPATSAAKAASKTAGGGGNGDTGRRPPYEKARDELASLVKRLEAGGLTLEQSLELWERGEQLADICEEWLEGARARLATAVARREERDDSRAPGSTPEAPF